MHITAILSLLALPTLTVADFLIGNCASYSLSNSTVLPGFSIKCDYAAVPATVNICSVNSTIGTHNDSGVCPGNDGKRSLDFCLAELTGSGCPSTFQMSTPCQLLSTHRLLTHNQCINTRDDCGDAFLASDDGSMPPDGFFYADLIDTARNNIAVGRCVYEGASKGQTNCSRGNMTRTCETFVKCYTGMYGTEEE